MLNEDEFQALMAKTRDGDQEAALKIVEIYEPEIRRAARMKMKDPRMRRIVDSMDICQSVFGKFFKSAVNGSFDLEKPEQLLGLLITMTRNRVVDEHRRQTAQKRKSADGEQIESDPEQIVQETSGPQTKAIDKELLTEVRSRLKPRELQIADLRNSGLSWDEISVELNESADGLRKRLERAIQRVRSELGQIDAQ